METTATLRASCDPQSLFAWVDDLSRYPRWLDIVPRAEPAPAADGDVGPAWMVTLRAQVGPLARSKRLRMVRTVHDAPRHVRFERHETDGRQHSPWVLDADVNRDENGAALVMRLHYGGSLWVPMLDRLLAGAIESSRNRLQALV